MESEEYVLITGGAGYIGSHANKLLSGKGYKTLVLDNLLNGHKEFLQWGHFIEGDIGNKDHLDRVFKRYTVKAVLHFAAYAYVGESVEQPEKYYINNVANTITLLQAMLKHKVNYFIFSSSCAAYGNPVEIPIPENHPQNPINPYGTSKMMVERILGDYSNAYGLKYVSLRYFNAAGADPDCEIGEWHEPETHLIPLVLDAAIGVKDSIRIFGTDYDTTDGTCIRDYIHVTDLADAHVLALEYLLRGGESDVFNVGNGNGFSVKQVIDRAQTVTGKSIKAVESDRRPGDPPVLIGSVARAKDVLKWDPKYHDLDIILDTAWKWQKKLYREFNKDEQNKRTVRM